MRNAQALRACPVRDGARPAFPGHLTSALGWPQGLPRTTHRRGRAGAAPERRQGLLRCRQVAARAPPPPLQRRGRGTCPRPWRSQDGDQRSARGAGLGGLAGTCRSSTPSEVLPVGGGGGEPPDTRSTSKAVRGGAAKLRSRYSSARTHHGREDGSDGPEAQAASVPAGPGDT